MQIILKDLKTLIKKLLNRKALRLDGILNEIIKIAILTIAKEVV